MICFFLGQKNNASDSAQTGEEKNSDPGGQIFFVLSMCILKAVARLYSILVVFFDDQGALLNGTLDWRPSLNCLVQLVVRL